MEYAGGDQLIMGNGPGENDIVPYGHIGQFLLQFLPYGTVSHQQQLELPILFPRLCESFEQYGKILFIGQSPYVKERLPAQPVFLLKASFPELSNREGSIPLEMTSPGDVQPFSCMAFNVLGLGAVTMSAAL